MSIPIEAIFAMLAIEVFRALAEPAGREVPETGLVVGATLGWILFQYLLAASLARRTKRRLRRGRASTAEIVEDFRFRLMINRIVLVVLCFAHIYFTSWPTFVERAMGLPAWSVLDDVVAIAPFVAAMAVGWIATYRADKMLSRRPWGLGEYVWFQARYSLLLVLLPWLVLKGIDDSREVWPERLRDIAGSAWVDAAAFAALAGLAVVFLPLFLKWLFRAVSMPASATRARLEALASKAGIRFRDVLVWRMERARILNAGVMGIVPRFSYVLFSDALLDSLSPAECEAVLGHEIGHTRHRHVLVYLVFTLGFAALAYDFMAFMPAWLRENYLASMPALAILAMVYFRLAFGYLSRAFERQADVYAAGLLGTPVPLILALEKIALMSGDVRELHSWRHSSVAERVRYLSAVGYDTSAQARYHGHVRRVVRGVAATVALLFAGALYLSLQEPEGLSAKIAWYEKMTATNPWNRHHWIRLGEVRADHGDFEAALEAFAKALELSPDERRALAGRMRLELRASERPDEALVAQAISLARELMEEGGDRAVGCLLAGEVRMSPAHGELYDPREAARLAQEALAIEGPKARASTYETVVRALLESGDEAGPAGRVLDEGLKRYPANPPLKALVARVQGG